MKRTKTIITSLNGNVNIATEHSQRSMERQFTKERVCQRKSRRAIPNQVARVTVAEDRVTTHLTVMLQNIVMENIYELP